MKLQRGIGILCTEVIFLENKKCWCYVTYAFLMDEMPPLPLPKPSSSAELPSVQPDTGGFEPIWFLNAKFPEDEE